MERLTHERMNGIKEGYWSPKKKEELVQRLAEYEDTGMEPEEINRERSKWLDTNMLQQLHMLKELLEARKWIPVEERLPEVGEYVLGTNKYDEVLVYRYGWNSPHTKKMFFSLCGAAAADITAWMPLPGPYRPDQAEK